MGEEFLQSFGLRLARLINPQLPMLVVQEKIMQVIAEVRAGGSISAVAGRGRPPGSSQLGAFAGRKLELVFAHECRVGCYDHISESEASGETYATLILDTTRPAAPHKKRRRERLRLAKSNHGCNALHCVLCKHNPNKRCSGNFATKYWVGDRLLAKCEGEIQVELIDTVTDERFAEDLRGYRIEACILEGQKYLQRCREVGEQTLDILDECEVPLNQKKEPLLVSGGATNTAENARLRLKFQNGVVPLRDIKVTESSESVLAGTKRPPFRLVVRAILEDGTRLPVRPAVSEEFVVVTKRTKNLKKQEIPSLDDPIAKLNHVGKETVKKLNELKASADEMQIDLGLPLDLARITKVKEFLRLARLSEADGHLQQKLKQLLKLSKEKWDMACEHAKTAVQVDNRMRAWYVHNMCLGLLYTCSLGDVRPDCPVALIQNRRNEGHDIIEVIPMEQQVPSQREQVQETCDQAIQNWWQPAHPGWMIFTLNNRHFETLDQIIQFSRSEQPAENAAAQEAGDEADFQQRPTFPLPDQMAADSASSGPSGNRSAPRDVQRPGSNHSGVANHPMRSFLERSSQAESPQHSAVERDRSLGFQPSGRQADLQAGLQRHPLGSFGGQLAPEAAPKGGSGGLDPNPFEGLAAMPYSLNAASQPLGEDSKMPRNVAALAAAWPQLESLGAGIGSMPSNLLPTLLSFNMLAKIGSVPSLGGLNEGSLISGLSSLQFPDLDVNGYSIATPQGGMTTTPSLGMGKTSNAEEKSGKRAAASGETDDAQEGRQAGPAAKRAALEVSREGSEEKKSVV